MVAVQGHATTGIEVDDIWAELTAQGDRAIGAGKQVTNQRANVIDGEDARPLEGGVLIQADQEVDEEAGVQLFARPGVKVDGALRAGIAAIASYQQSQCASMAPLADSSLGSSGRL